MDLNQKTLVSQEYCTGFVDCRHTESQTIATILFVLLMCKELLHCKNKIVILAKYLVTKVA